MSVSSSIDFRFQPTILTRELLFSLIDSGWSFEKDGVVSYLAVGDADDFNWRKDRISRDSLFEIVSEKEKLGELIGVAMYWRGTKIGGEILFHTSSAMSMILSMNRMVNSKGITDVTWYLDRLVPAFKKNLESISFSEHV